MIKLKSQTFSNGEAKEQRLSTTPTTTKINEISQTQHNSFTSTVPIISGIAVYLLVQGSAKGIRGSDRWKCVTAEDIYWQSLIYMYELKFARTTFDTSFRH